MDRTFVMVKPDGVQRGLIGEFISRFEAKGLKLVGAKLERLSKERVIEQYREHLEKPFFPGLASYIMSGPCFLMAWEGKDAVQRVRKLLGATNPGEALPGTIRGDLGLDIGRNVIHGADSPESARRELGIYFRPEEIIDYEKEVDRWLYE